MFEILEIDISNIDFQDLIDCRKPLKLNELIEVMSIGAGSQILSFEKDFQAIPVSALWETSSGAAPAL